MSEVIKKLLIQDAEFYGEGARMTSGRLQMWAEVLSGYDPIQVKKAMLKKRTESERRFQPFPADLIETIFGYETAEEAWASAPKDDDSSAVCSNEAMIALGAAMPLIIQGDMYGARLTFIARYDEEVKKAIFEKRKPKYIASLGFDKSRQDAVLLKGVDEGKISPMLALDKSQTLQIPDSILKKYELEHNVKLQLAAPEKPEETVSDEQREKVSSLVKKFLGSAKKMEDTE